MNINNILTSKDLTSAIPINNNNKISSDNYFFIVHQNIRSLRQNFDLLICNLEAFKKPPDIKSVSEIWIYSYEIKDFAIPNYTFYAKTQWAASVYLYVMYTFVDLGATTCQMPTF